MTLTRTKILLLAVASAGIGAAAQAEDVPLIGTWDCEGTVVSFVNDLYDDGAQSRPISGAEAAADGSYTIFVDGTAVATVSGVGDDRMSLKTGRDAAPRKCARLFTE